jgi:hypothetical protein
MDRAVSYGFPGESAGAEVPVTPFLVAGPDAGALERWMDRTVPDSPLSGLGQAFVFEGEAHGVDPRLLVAIALQESRLGTQGSGAGRHNAFGLGPGNAYLTWQAGVAAAARTIASYARDGLSTIVQIQTRWAPVGASNDPAGLNGRGGRAGSPPVLDPVRASRGCC